MTFGDEMKNQLTTHRLAAHPDRVGNFMFTSSGKKYFPCDPRPEEVEIEVIAHHLAMQCRFNGATREFYSVAEHCVHASRLVPKEYALEALLHDAAEAYLGDIIRPLKYIREFGEFYLKAERLNEEAIAKKFGLTYPFPPCVKRADEALVTQEIRELVDHGGDEGPLHERVEIPNIRLYCWEPEVAASMFLARYYDIMLDDDSFWAKRKIAALSA
jgi:uncharacterized protein